MPLGMTIVKNATQIIGCMEQRVRRYVHLELGRKIPRGNVTPAPRGVKPAQLPIQFVKVAMELMGC